LAGERLEKLRVLVVDDSSLDKKILVQAVESTGLGQVEHTASSGPIALERLKQRSMDVVLLKVLMPEVKATDTLEVIRKEYPHICVIMVSDGEADSAADTVKALEMGALDFILRLPEVDPEKNVVKIKNHLQGLFTQIMTVKYTSSITPAGTVAEPARPAFYAPAAPTEQVAGKKALSGVDLVVIASSTGGPVALETICKNLPAGFSKPVLVVQHMPAEFTRKLAQSLDKKCALPVVETEEDLVKPGRVMIAPGGVHTTVIRSGSSKVIKLKATPPVNGVRPSADVLFRSVARAYQGERILAVILTGMGSDGVSGIKEMKKTCDCYCLVQSEKTCVVYGMPGNVVSAGLADEVEDLNMIPSRLLQIVSGRGL